MRVTANTQIDPDKAFAFVEELIPTFCEKFQSMHSEQKSVLEFAIAMFTETEFYALEMYEYRTRIMLSENNASINATTDSIFIDLKTGKIMMLIDGDINMCFPVGEEILNKCQLWSEIKESDWILDSSSQHALYFPLLGKMVCVEPIEV